MSAENQVKMNRSRAYTAVAESKPLPAVQILLPRIIAGAVCLAVAAAMIAMTLDGVKGLDPFFSCLLLIPALFAIAWSERRIERYYRFVGSQQA